MADKIQWGLLATGAIARAFARGLRDSRTGSLLAVGSRTQEQADRFGSEFNVPRRYGSYEALLADRDVQAVYISTPHPMHAEWAIKAAEAGKHLLVEKPLALNQYEAEAIVEKASRNDLFLMEAYMYRCHPQTARLVELLRNHVIGDVHVIQATFSFQAAFSPESRLWSNALGGGGMLDVGGYTTSIARLIAGASLGRDALDALAVSGAGSLHPQTGVDMWAVGTMKFEGGIVASIATGMAVNQENVVRIFGRDGNILLPNPYVAARDGAAPGRIIVNRRGQPAEEIAIDSPVSSFTHEADAVGRAILAGRQQAEPPAMTWRDSIANARALDAWRAAVGLVYEAEKPQNVTHTLTRRPLKAAPDAPMTYARIEHLDKPVARLIMGVDNQNTMPHLATLCDDYFEYGGNAFDTAWVYGAARSKLLGQWLRNRGIRNQVCVISKGAHTPLCTPANLTAQLFEQLDWLGLDDADIYMMHRDNPDVPVGEFIDVLNDHVAAGRIRAFGGSNWSCQRVSEANAYARRTGKQGFSVVSNNLSLAEMVHPVWAGCIHAHDAASRRWFEETRIPLLSWSSQARGFFVPERAQPGRCDDASLVKCWYSDDNFRRQARAIELAHRHGVEPVNIALAWVLCQPFPTFALIGPRALRETRSCMRALGVSLTPAELAYLDLG